MPNNYFQFKQFRIEQEGVGMKVTTEGCILGGWVDPRLQPKRILDIGAGTGLLALMMAQKFPEAYIDAVELDGHACEIAANNFENSPWSDRLCLHEGKIQEFHPGGDYDLIVCNPPFYHRSLMAEKSHVNKARHDSSLSQGELVEAIARLLSDDGVAYILYPLKESDRLITLLEEEQLHLNQELSIYNRKPDIPQKVFRKIIRCSFQSGEAHKEQFIIRDPAGSYTEQFRELLTNYYLNL